MLKSCELSAYAVITVMICAANIYVSGQCSPPAEYKKDTWFQTYSTDPYGKWVYGVFTDSAVTTKRSDNNSMTTITYNCISSYMEDSIYYYVYDNIVLGQYCAKCTLIESGSALLVTEVQVDTAVKAASDCVSKFPPGCFQINNAFGACSAVWKPQTPLESSPTFTAVQCPFQGNYPLTVSYPSEQCAGDATSTATALGTELTLSACSQASNITVKERQILKEKLTCLGDTDGASLTQAEVDAGINVMLIASSDQQTIYCARYKVEGGTVRMAIDVQVRNYAACGYSDLTAGEQDKFLVLAFGTPTSTIAQGSSTSSKPATTGGQTTVAVTTRGASTGGGTSAGKSTAGASTAAVSTGGQSTGGQSTARATSGGASTAAAATTAAATTRRASTAGATTAAKATTAAGATTAAKATTAAGATTAAKATTAAGATTAAVNTGGVSTGMANTGGANTGGANTGGASTVPANTGGANTNGANTGGLSLTTVAVNTGAANTEPESSGKSTSGNEGESTGSTTPQVTNPCASTTCPTTYQCYVDGDGKAYCACQPGMQASGNATSGNSTCQPAASNATKAGNIILGLAIAFLGAAVLAGLCYFCTARTGGICYRGSSGAAVARRTIHEELPQYAIDYAGAHHHHHHNHTSTFYDNNPTYAYKIQPPTFPSRGYGAGLNVGSYAGIGNNMMSIGDPGVSNKSYVLARSNIPRN